MALIKVKPTSPGRRAVVKVVTPELHKGKPHAPLLEKQSKNAGRNNNGHITTRHQGGGHKQHYRIVATRTVSSPRLSVWNTIRTVAPIWHCCAMPTVSVATSLPRAVSPQARNW